MIPYRPHHTITDNQTTNPGTQTVKDYPKCVLKGLTNAIINRVVPHHMLRFYIIQDLFIITIFLTVIAKKGFIVCIINLVLPDHTPSRLI